MNKNACPKCGGKIVAEAVGSYGILYYIRKDGTLGRKLREAKYECTGEWLYYCPVCGTNYDKEDIIGRKFV